MQPIRYTVVGNDGGHFVDDADAIATLFPGMHNWLEMFNMARTGRPAHLHVSKFVGQDPERGKFETETVEYSALVLPEGDAPPSFHYPGRNAPD